MHVQGTVLRVSDAGANYPRVALRVNYMDFRSFHMRLSAMDALQPEAEPWMA